METQLKIVTKEEAHKMIDDVPGSHVLILTYDKKNGISDKREYIKKEKSKKLVNKAKTLVLAENKPIAILNLHNCLLSDNYSYKKENIYKSIMLAKLE